MIGRYALSFKIEPAEAARGELLGFDRIVDQLLLLHRNQHADVPREINAQMQRKSNVRIK